MPLGDGADGVYQRIEYSRNRQGQAIGMKDPNETEHAYGFDGLGRPTQDGITAFGDGVDETIKRIETTYDS